MAVMNKFEKQNWYRFFKQGGNPATNRCPVNKFVCHNGTENGHNKHEHAKLEKFLQLVHDGHKVLCEGICNKTKVRHDLIDISDGIIYEIICTSKSKSLVKSMEKGINPLPVEFIYIEK